ncbi:MAG: hypothetical protein HYU51_17890 [Candidatus Rokubacteria bacterium]|nr:hypothetical protein [Candidatus Rokubacteria bacterium]
MGEGRDADMVEVDHGETRRANDALDTEDGGESSMNAATDATLRRIDLTVARLMLTHDQLPLDRRSGYLEARKRLRRARVRRFRQLQ